MKFCSDCGQALSVRVPPGDHLPRFVCDACGSIHYENPKPVAGCVPEYQGQILICRRAIEPRRGFWTIPAGFMENGETLMAGAARESMEEALAHVEIGSLLTIVHVTHAHQVHVMFRARLIDGEYGVGPESLECMLVEEKDVPWKEIAFASTYYSLERYFEDRAAGREQLHITEIDRSRPQ